jgi:hypothetical protein
LEINFPHNFSLVGPFFPATTGAGVTVTVLPLLPITVSNLTLTDGSSLAPLFPRTPVRPPALSTASISKQLPRNHENHNSLQ